MKKAYLLKMAFVACIGLATGCNTKPAGSSENIPSLTQFVDPKIGSGGHGHVFVGANVPFGFVQLGPTSVPQEWDWTSGYHVSDSTVIGFPHLHLSGTGIGDLHDITVMPVTGEVVYARGVTDDPQSGLWSYSDRSREQVRPGYYATHLTRYDIDVELTATKRVGFHRYTFPGAEASGIVFDLQNGGGWDRATEASVRVIDDRTICGYRYSRGWANDQRVYFHAEFSRPFKAFRLIADGQPVQGASATASVLYGRADFETEPGDTILLKVALSPTSAEAARRNLAAELPDWDFRKTVKAADEAWNRELAKIDVTTRSESDRRVFYTALYHTMIAPSVFCDVDSTYYGADKQIHPGEGFVNYTTFSLWDTYRGAHPLMTIIHPEKMADIINTMLHIHEQQGKLPVWHLMGCETNCMTGNPGIPVVADALIKGFGGFDREAAYEALKQSAMRDERGMKYRKQYGYLPCDKMKESVAYDLEYALADWCVAEAAKVMGKKEDEAYFRKRSQSYRQLFDPTTGFLRGRNSAGEFREPFNPFRSVHREDDYCEGNAWQYTWLVPHDVEGLIGCFGSRERFLNKLDSLFIVTGDAGEMASPDISGLIGQYAHGNEPGHHTCYLYTLAGAPEKTADRIRYILRHLYSDRVDGICGNEDVGQMSAWYILSALGFYPVEPAGGRYVFGSPLFDKAVLQVSGGTFTITARNNSEQNRYIQSVRLNGEPYRQPWINHADITAGGTLELTMGAKPARWF